MTVPGYEIRQTQERFHGAVFDLVTDEVAMPDGSTAARDYIRHGGAVSVVALDSDESVMLVRQYRHAAREVLWELPAGLLDVPGEDPARRPRGSSPRRPGWSPRGGSRWSRCTPRPDSPTRSSGSFWRRSSARSAPSSPITREFEEAQLTTHVVPLTEAVAMVDRGEITNGPSALGLLAAWHRRQQR